MESVSVNSFYRDMFGENACQLDHFFENQSAKNIGHFNVFNIEKLFGCGKQKTVMPYNRRLYYKISLIKGRNLVEYADKTVEIEKQGILFATPKIPYRYVPMEEAQSGYFCLFTKDFLSRSNTGVLIDDFPIFKPGSDFVYQLNDEQFRDLENIYEKMDKELSADYAFKYDLIRTYVLELIHMGQKLKPMSSSSNATNAASRITALFIELLERQFPIESDAQVVQLKAPNDFALALGIHINHLNKVLKETTGRKTSEIINGRILEEAKILLNKTKWNVSEIAYALGFEEVAHFSNFFKKHTSLSPLKFRN